MLPPRLQSQISRTVLCTVQVAYVSCVLLRHTTLNPEDTGRLCSANAGECFFSYVPTTSPCVDTAHLALADAAAQKHTADEVRRGEVRLVALEAQSTRGAV
eukprot:scaffold91817_cov75-Phaeocystis_antarctica.AAC.2